MQVGGLAPETGFYETQEYPQPVGFSNTIRLFFRHQKEITSNLKLNKQVTLTVQVLKSVKKVSHKKTCLKFREHLRKLNLTFKPAGINIKSGWSRVKEVRGSAKASKMRI